MIVGTELISRKEEVCDGWLRWKRKSVADEKMCKWVARRRWMVRDWSL